MEQDPGHQSTAKEMSRGRLSSRQRFKCQECRRKKAKCLPQDRDWSAGEKCIACQKGGQSCGPNVAPSVAQKHWDEESRQVNADSPSPRDTASPIRGLRIPRDSAFLGPSKGEASVSSSLPQYRRDIPGEDLRQRSAGPSRAVRRQSVTAPDGTRNASAEIKLKLKTLGDLQILHQTIQSRLKHSGVGAVLANQNTEAANLPEVARDFVAFVITQEFRSVLQDIDRLAESLDGSESELYLLRALNAIDSYGAASDLQQLFAEPEISIVKKLVAIYEEQGDLPAEQHMLERRIRLRVNSGVLSVAHDEPRVSSLLASRYVATSHRLSDIVGRISIPQKYRIFGADPFPPLHQTLLSGLVEASRLLIESAGGKFSEPEAAAYPAVAGHGDFLDADPFSKIDFLQRNVLHVAIESDNLWLLDLPAISNPSLINGRDRYGRSPILLAAANGSLEAVKKLVQAGAELTHRDENGVPIMTLAANSGNAALVKYLLDQKVSPDDAMGFASPPLHAAAKTGHWAICELLLKAGASFRSPALSTHGKTAAQVAEEAGFRELAETLRTYELREQRIRLSYSNEDTEDEEERAGWSIDDGMWCPAPKRAPCPKTTPQQVTPFLASTGTVT